MSGTQPISNELWRKPETVSLSKFPPCFHEPILRGLQIIRGEIPEDDAHFENLGEQSSYFSPEDLNILRERLGAQLVHGDYSIAELRDILQQSTQDRPSKSSKR